MKKMALLLLLTLTLVAENLSVSEEQLLKRISKGFSQVAKFATPAVVFIESEIEEKLPNGRGGQRGANDNPFDYFHDDLLHRFFGFPQGRERGPRKQFARGSGFLVSDDGYIMTNNHLVDCCTKVTVTLHDGKTMPATIVGTDPKSDLAVLKIEGKKFPFLDFGDSDKLEVGDWLIAIGNPFSLQATVTVGVVSAKGRNNLQIVDFEDFIQTDAAINPGNSGGPALDVEGKVVGINTAIASASGGYMGIGFAIPSRMAKQIMEQLIKQGKVTRGYIGVALQPLTKDLADFYHRDANQGALIADIVADSPADKAGLQPEDVIIAYNDLPVENLPAFRNAVAFMEPGSKLKLKILRDGKTMEKTVVVAQLPAEFAEPSAPLQKLGIKVQALTPELMKQLGLLSSEAAVVVTSVEPESPAAAAGLRPGSLILAVNRKKVDTLEQFYAAINQASSEGKVLLKVQQGELTRFVVLHFSQ